MVAESSSIFLCKNEELYIAHFEIRLPVSVKNHSLQHHNGGKTVYLDKIPLYAIQKFCMSFFLASCAINPIFIITSKILVLTLSYSHACNQTYTQI